MAPLARRPTGLTGAMGLMMTFAIAGALLVLSVSGVNATGAFALLWGSILATRTVDVVVLAVLTVVVHRLFWRQRRELGLVVFDRELALCSVDALTLLPALGARNLGRSLRSMVVWSIVFGLLGNAVGFVVALAVDQPLGPVLVLVAGALTLLSYLLPEGALNALTPSGLGDRPASVARGPAKRLRQP